MARTSHVQDLIDGQVAGDPLTRAIVDATEAGTARALEAHLPKLVLTRTETARILGVSVDLDAVRAKLAQSSPGVMPGAGGDRRDGGSAAAVPAAPAPEAVA